MSVSIRRPAPKTLTFICFNHDETELERRLLFRPVENHRHMDIPGLYRLHTLLKLHKPTDPEKDPFLVALVIALAQKKRRHAPQPEPPSSSFAVGRLLLLFSFLFSISSLPPCSITLNLKDSSC